MPYSARNVNLARDRRPTTCDLDTSLSVRRLRDLEVLAL